MRYLRLAHVDKQGLIRLADYGCLGNDRISNVKFCENCILEEFGKVRFNKKIHRNAGIADYIHSGKGECRRPHVNVELDLKRLVDEEADKNYAPDTDSL